MLYVLKSPGGHLIEETVSTSNSEAWGKAFDFISATDKDFERRYWHKWDASRRAARKRGWVIVRATLTANVDVTGPRLRGSGGQQGSAAPEPSSGD